MKNNIKYLFLITLLLFPSCSKSPTKKPLKHQIDIKTVEKLIEELPCADILSQKKKVLHDSKSSKNDIKLAKEEIEKAKLIIPKLRKHIKKGSSIFDYPGLIEKGRIKYRPPRLYLLYLGVYLKSEEGKGPYDFRVIFNKQGIIEEIQDVDWCH